MPNKYLWRFYAPRRRLKAGLIIAGACAGALGGVVLTVLGKIVAGAPPATLQNYLWNAAVFGIIGAVFNPLITWSSLRRVPLWKTVVGPLAAGVAGAGAGVLLGSGAAFLMLPPVGIGAAYWWLTRAEEHTTAHDFATKQLRERD